MYTEDAYVLPAGAEMVRGNHAIIGFGRGNKSNRRRQIATVMSLPLAVPPHARSATFSFRPKTRHPQKSSANTRGWRRVSGQWKLGTDIGT